MQKNKVAAYIFYSIYDPKRVEEHKNSIIKFAEEQLNISSTKIDFYIDMTPRNKRVQINELMKKIEQKEYNVLLLYHCNHLHKIRGRNYFEQSLEMNKLINIRDKILDNGVKIYSVKENKSISRDSNNICS